MVHVKGKRGRQVPVLLSKIDEDAIAALIEFRSNVGVLHENVFVFAAPTRGSKNFLRGNDGACKVLNAVTELKHPERIRSTEIRKYCATVSQLADLSENHLRWLADHMGHNIDVHREYYRLRESTVEVTKVARLLCAIDEGNTESIQGKKLSEINIEGKCDISLWFFKFNSNAEY